MSVIGKKIGFVSGPNGFGFAKPIIEHVAKTNMVRAWEYKDGADTKDLRFLLNWADLVWVEWADNLFASISQAVDEKSHLVCRVHSYEAFDKAYESVKWSNVRRLVFVAAHVRDRFVDGIKRIEGARVPQSVVIQNGVDTEKFPLTDTHDLSKIAMVGYLNYKKGPQLAISVAERIKRINPSAKLVVVGTSQDPRCEQYMKEASLSMGLDVEFREWTDDVASVYAECGFVLSSSLWESFQYSIAEGVLSGCVPLVHNWAGADAIYPKRFIFKTVDDAARIYKKVWRMSPEEQLLMTSKNRQFITDKYNWPKQLHKIDTLLQEALKRVRRPKSVGIEAGVSGTKEESDIQSPCVEA